MDAGAAPCDGGVMDDGFFPLPDEVHGARAGGCLLAGDLDCAEAELARVQPAYLLRFLCRLAVVTPGVSLRLGWRVAARRGWLRPPGGS